MNFIEALKVLGIEKYKERIFRSNSHGELFHLRGYIMLGEIFEKDEHISGWFPSWFEDVVKSAEESWSRPESIFQYIPELFCNAMVKSSK